MKSNEKEIISKGKHLAFLLRHDKDAFESGLIDAHGWREVSELIREHGYTQKMLDEIVETNNKQRYEYSKDCKKIRARQGHSIPVDVELTEAIPPDVLYHGTSHDAYWNHIVREGLKPMKRLHVHLSEDVDTAYNVGSRYSERGNGLVILKINTMLMSSFGKKFYRSNNGVWLTDFVSPEFIDVFIDELNDKSL